MFQKMMLLSFNYFCLIRITKLSLNETGMTWIEPHLQSTRNKRTVPPLNFKIVLIHKNAISSRDYLKICMIGGVALSVHKIRKIQKSNGSFQQLFSIRKELAELPASLACLHCRKSSNCSNNYSYELCYCFRGCLLFMSPSGRWGIPLQERTPMGRATFRSKFTWR